MDGQGCSGVATNKRSEDLSQRDLRLDRRKVHALFTVLAPEAPAGRRSLCPRCFGFGALSSDKAVSDIKYEALKLE